MDIKEQDPKIMARLLHFLYFGYYHAINEECKPEGHSDAHLQAHGLAQVANANQRIDIWPQEFESTWSPGLDHFTYHADMYQSADKYGIKPLKELAVNHHPAVMDMPVRIAQFGQGIRMFYDN